MRPLLAAAGIVVTTCTVGCHTRDARSSDSDTKQIFSDQRRATVQPADYKYILNMSNVCTAFVLDAEKLIGMTADHCSPAVGGRLCSGSANLRDKSCAFPATITGIVEKSPTANLDYVIFTFAFQGAKPDGLEAVRLAKNDQLKAALEQRADLAMVGYPADKYQKANLTRSDCRVRKARVEPSRGSSFAKQMLAAWESDASFTSHPAYADMRSECYFIEADGSSQSRPSFMTDCSVYGGNSGGPILVASSRVVVGMPATYLPEGSYTPTCYKKKFGDSTYWDIFFRPITGTEVPTYDNDNWDKLDRDDAALTRFPTAVPMHLIAQESAFLRANPAYLADDIFKPAGADAPPANADVFVALGVEKADASDSYSLHVATAVGAGSGAIARVDYCVSERPSLCPDQTKLLTTRQVLAISDRRVFASQQAVDLARGPRSFSIVAKDTLGRIVSARSVRFDPK